MAKIQKQLQHANPKARNHDTQHTINNDFQKPTIRPAKKIAGTSVTPGGQSKNNYSGNSMSADPDGGSPGKGMASLPDDGQMSVGYSSANEKRMNVRQSKEPKAGEQPKHHDATVDEHIRPTAINLVNSRSLPAGAKSIPMAGNKTMSQPLRGQHFNRTDGRRE